MGVGISNWRLARTVSTLGHLGVVSGTALDQLLVRRLQTGDQGGHMRRALDAFPVADLAAAIVDRYYVPDGKARRESFQTLPMPSATPSVEWQSLVMIASYVEVFLARDGHSNPIGINFLEKIQTPHLPAIYGAMLAGVEYVLMGAGIPMKIPGVLDRFAHHEPATYPLTVSGIGADDGVMLSFDPREFVGVALPPLTRPKFLAIIASDVLALSLVRRANGKVDGFIVEGPTAGGHNAPPRGPRQANERGEPIYGPRDVVNLDKLKALGLPFWLAGGSGTAQGVREALAAGAQGVQVGTAFAMCAESGLRDDLRRTLLAQVREGSAAVVTNAVASPTGFPFKVATVPGTLSDAGVLAARPRICDLGYLREAYRTADGTIDFRCPSEPVNVFESKGGDRADTQGRACICNALLATAGLPQIRAGKLEEPPIVTMGDDLRGVGRFLRPGATDYSAADVIATLTAEL
ncbi:MAG: nitronate monooxygenase [Acidobacteria bacterium]|nr:nitronate monooxygenase [Acidobacteriota bacterium]